MKIKLIALAVAALVSGAANAALTVSTSTANANTVLLNVWDATGSYTRGLGMDFSTFSAAAAAAAPGDFLTLNLANDVAFQSFISGRSTFNWDIIGANTVGNYGTVSTTNLSTVLPTALSNTVMNTGTSNILNFMGQINGGINTSVANALATGIAATDSNGVDSLYTSSITASTYVTANNAAPTGKFLSGTAIFGTNNNNSFASGLHLLKEVVATTGLAKTTQTYFAGNSAYIDSANVLHIGTVAAVPEPESFALLLAGLGMIGSIASRRARKA